MKKAPAGGIVRVSLDNTWRTPESILDAARAYFGGPIPFDPATGPENPTSALRFCAGPPGTMFAGTKLEEQSGLEVAWAWPTWCNPPYGAELNKWLAKIVHEAERGAEIVSLLPCNRFEGEPLQRALERADALCLHRGRVKFISSIDGKPVSGNPYASMLVGWNVDRARWRAAFKPLGGCVFFLREVAP